MVEPPTPPAGPIAITATVASVAALLRESDAPAACWLAEALALWAAGVEFDAAVGLSGTWRTAVQHHAQMRALALLAATGAASERARAARVAERLHAYETTRWPGDRRAGRRPSGVEGPCYDYLLAAGPTSPDRIRHLLVACRKA